MAFSWPNVQLRARMDSAFRKTFRDKFIKQFIQTINLHVLGCYMNCVLTLPVDLASILYY